MLIYRLDTKLWNLTWGCDDNKQYKHVIKTKLINALWTFTIVHCWGFNDSNQIIWIFSNLVELYWHNLGVRILMILLCKNLNWGLNFNPLNYLGLNLNPTKHFLNSFTRSDKTKKHKLNVIQFSDKIQGFTEFYRDCFRFEYQLTKVVIRSQSLYFYIHFRMFLLFEFKRCNILSFSSPPIDHSWLLIHWFIGFIALFEQ